MAAPHLGHMAWAHGTPRACATVVPHWGQTHVPLGPAAKGPRMRPRPGPPTPRPRPLPPAPPPRPKPGPCRNGPVPSPRGMTSPLHTWSVAAMARARGRTRPQGPARAAIRPRYLRALTQHPSAERLLLLCRRLKFPDPLADFLKRVAEVLGPGTQHLQFPLWRQPAGGRGREAVQGPALPPLSRPHFRAGSAFSLPWSGCLGVLQAAA